jgi:hypothetical protein
MPFLKLVDRAFAFVSILTHKEMAKKKSAVKM